jgi:hypothetical protein
LEPVVLVEQPQGELEHQAQVMERLAQIHNLVH